MQKYEVESVDTHVWFLYLSKIVEHEREPDFTDPLYGPPPMELSDDVIQHFFAVSVHSPSDFYVSWRITGGLHTKYITVGCGV